MLLSWGGTWPAKLLTFSKLEFNLLDNGVIHDFDPISNVIFSGHELQFLDEKSK